jgi:hypothetical protein
MLKGLRAEDRNLALKGLRNCAWDLTYVTWWGELLKKQKSENRLNLAASSSLSHWPINIGNPEVIHFSAALARLGPHDVHMFIYYRLSGISTPMSHFPERLRILSRGEVKTAIDSKRRRSSSNGPTWVRSFCIVERYKTSYIQWFIGFS